MNKLLNKKKLLSFPDALRYLSQTLGEEVLLADLYELVLDKELTASVRLFEQSYSIRQEVELVDRSLAAQESHDEEMRFSKRVHVIDGIWDLVMIGLENYKIRELYQKEINGPVPVLSELNAFYLQRDGVVYQLLDALPLSSSEDHQEAIKAKFDSLLKSKGVTAQDIFENGNHEGINRLNQDELEQILLLSDSESAPEGEIIGYLPLEEASYQLGIRIEELNRFVQSLNNRTVGDKPLDIREQNTYLVIIGAMCEELKIDPKQRGLLLPFS